MTAITQHADSNCRLTPTLDETFQQVHRVALSQGISRSAVLLWDAAANELYVRSQMGWPSDWLNSRIPLLDPLACLVPRVYAPGGNGEVPYVTGIDGTHSGLMLPLLGAGSLVGVLDLQAEVADFFNQTHIEQAESLATQAALALRLDHCEEVGAQRATHLEAISAISRQTTAALTDLNELLARFCALLLEHFPVDHVGVFLLKHEELILRSHCGRLWLAAPQGVEKTTQDTGLCRRALSKEDSEYAEDVARDGSYVGWLAGVQSELCFPLISFGQPVGALSLCSSKPRAFGSLDFEALACVAEICASAIRNATHFHQVQSLAYRDGLTGVFNRRFFETRLSGELERAIRYHSALSLLLIDVDNFKLINDKFGHQLGDEALRKVAETLERQLRKADIICRYGGDEFATLLPEIPSEKACAVAERVRTAVAEMEIGGFRTATLSIGVAAYPEHANTCEQLIQFADQALYIAKQAGRNRMALYQPAR